MGVRQLPTEDQRDVPEALHVRQDGTLHGRWLVLTHCVGAILIVVLLAFFIANLPVYFAQLETVCVHEHCPHWQLTPVSTRVLQNMNLSLRLYAILTLSLSLFAVAVWLAVAVFIIWCRPKNWVALLASLLLVTQGIALAYGSLSTPLEYESPVWHVPTVCLIVFDTFLYLLIFSLFPNGRFVPGWMGWLVAGEITLGALLAVVFFATSSSVMDTLITPNNAWIIVCMDAGMIAAQVYRYRHVSSRVERRQTKWVIPGIVGGPLLMVAYFFPPMFVPALGGPDSLYFLLFKPVFTIFFLFAPLCFGIAILRNRLWDINILIKRTLVSSILTLSLIGLYVLVVVGLGTLLQARGSPFLSLLATGLIAVLFQPWRLRLQVAVNRLIYGERDDPYTVISRLGKRLEATVAPDTVLSSIVEAVAQALKLPYAAITLKYGDEFSLEASYGVAKGKLEHLPLVYQTELVGELLLAPRTPGESFTRPDRRLLDDLARQAGVAAHSVRLTHELKRLTQDLQQTRERLVSTREEERRRLRRDLHDGLGPLLSSQMLLLTSARMQLRQDPDEAEVILGSTVTQLRQAIGDIRRLVYALRPPALDDLGLVVAIQEQLTQNRASGIDFTFDAPEQLPPLPAAVEVACYRMVQEAVTNVTRHAQARTCVVRLACREQVSIEVIDDGLGLPPTYRCGVGLTSMRERAEELGGSWLIEPGLDGGTRVQMRIPY
jgi:signal transduction histidine kinase